MDNFLPRVREYAVRAYERRIHGASHQRKNMERMEKKWNLIGPILGRGPGSVLDIGCSEGFYTRYAAKQGWFAIGVDFNPQAISFASRSVQKNRESNVAFMVSEVDLDFARSLPQFDCILLLSVFQEIYVKLGRQAALQFFGLLLSKCRRRVLFEPSSTSRKFGEESLFAADNDRRSIEAWVRELVSPYKEWRVALAGETPYTNNEPVRFMFRLDRAQAPDPA